MQIIASNELLLSPIVRFAALGIAEVILLRALPTGLTQNVPSSIVRAARHHLAVAHSGLTRMMTLSQFNPVWEGQ
jgi:hypothetical protein